MPIISSEPKTFHENGEVGNVTKGSGIVVVVVKRINKRKEYFAVLNEGAALVVLGGALRQISDRAEEVLASTEEAMMAKHLKSNSAEVDWSIFELDRLEPKGLTSGKEVHEIKVYSRTNHDKNNHTSRPVHPPTRTVA